MRDPLGLGRLPHIHASIFESRVLSDYTGTAERARVDKSPTNAIPPFFRFEYTSVAYDIFWKTGVTGFYDTVERIQVRKRPKSIK